MTIAAARKIEPLDFADTVFHGLAGLLLSVGALHVVFSEARTQRRAVLLLATIGVQISPAAVGVDFVDVTRSLDNPVSRSACYGV